MLSNKESEVYKLDETVQSINEAYEVESGGEYKIMDHFNKEFDRVDEKFGLKRVRKVSVSHSSVAIENRR